MPPPAAAEDIKVGTKVSIKEKDATAKEKKGVVAFCGATEFAAGKWVGVILEVPAGKNNGSVGGKTYFSCEDKYGIFVRANQLTIIEEPTSTPVKQSRQLKPPTSSKLQPPKKLSTNVKPTEASPSAAASSENLAVSSAETTSAVGQHEDKESSGEVVTRDPGASTEIELLQSQVQDLTEKLNTLKVKRAEDREKMKEFNTYKTQAAILPELKAKMSELVREVAECKKKAEEADGALKAKIEEYADVGDTMEMLTLDKEMSEEKCETLKLENEGLTLRVKELELDLQVIKEQIETKGTEGAANDYQYKQLEAQYNRQKEALLRLRDLMTEENSVKEGLIKENKRLQGVVTNLTAEKDKLVGEKAEMEESLNNLQENVDAAFGSEKMIEMLSARNLELEDRVTEQEETIQELEELNDMNTEIQENFRETELALREDLDFKENELRSLNTRNEHYISVISDHQNTILKFRQLVQQLKDENNQLKTSIPETLEEPNKSMSTIPESSPGPQYLAAPMQSAANIELKNKQSNVQNTIKLFEGELKDLEIKQLNEQSTYLLAYLPESFSKPSGDLDCIRVSILLPRLSEKLNILAKYIKLKNGVTTLDEIAALADSTDGQSKLTDEDPGFALTLSVHLQSLQILVTQVNHILNCCTVEKYMRLGSLYPEMLVHEKSIDQLIQYFKKEHLDSTVKLDGVTRALAFFQQLLEAVFHGQKWNNSKFLEDNLNFFIEASQCVSVCSKKILSFLSPNLDLDDFTIYLKDMIEISADIKKSCRKLRKIFPQDSTKMLAVNDSVRNELLGLQRDFKSFAVVWFTIAQEAEVAASVLNEGEYLSNEKLCEIRNQSAFDHQLNYHQIKLTPGSVQTSMGQMSRMGDEGEFEETDKVENQFPVFLHAEQLKLEALNQSRSAVDADTKAAELKEAKIKLKQKEEEIGSLNVKIDLLEQKAKSAPKAYEEKMRILKDEAEKLRQEIESAKKTHEITLNALDQEIKELETQNKDLKGRIQVFTMKNLYGGLTKYAQEATKGEGTAKLMEDPLLKEEVMTLRGALKCSQQEIWRLKGERMRAQLAKLSPLPNLKKPTGLASSTGLVKLDGGDKSTSLGNLSRQASSLVSELERLCVMPRVVNVANRKPGTIPAVDKLSSAQQLVAINSHNVKVNNKLETLREKVLNLTAQEYPVDESSEAPLFADRKKLLQMKENLDPTLVAKIYMPADKKKKSGTTKVFLSREQFFELHKSLLA